MPPVPGIEHAISSDGFFALEHQPKSVAVIGSGYIGIELAGIFNALGTEVSIFSRSDRLLRAFDVGWRPGSARRLPPLTPGGPRRRR